MIEYISGKLIEKTPTYAIIEAGGMGYMLHISLNTFEKIPDSNNCKLLTHYAVSVDVRSGSSSHTLFGFINNEERDLFKILIGVSGVSANTGRMILSSLSPSELTNAVMSENVAVIKSVKGIGPKLAQRIITELKDKIAKGSGLETFSVPLGNTTHNEALSALLALGFDKFKAGKVLTKIIKEKGANTPIEEVIKLALKQM